MRSLDPEASVLSADELSCPPAYSRYGLNSASSPSLGATWGNVSPHAGLVPGDLTRYHQNVIQTQRRPIHARIL